MNYNKISDDVILGKDVIIHNFVNLYGCNIGSGTKIGAFVEIQKGVNIGDRCKISSHTFICEGVKIENEVFIGHNVTFINDKNPRSTNLDSSMQTEGDWTCTATLIKRNASIGSSATIMCGIIIGENAVIGAGSVVTKDIPDNSVAYGNPAKIR